VAAFLFVGYLIVTGNTAFASVLDAIFGHAATILAEILSILTAFGYAWYRTGKFAVTFAEHLRAVHFKNVAALYSAKK
jgi:hypothetical protein